MFQNIYFHQNDDFEVKTLFRIKSFQMFTNVSSIQLFGYTLYTVFHLSLCLFYHSAPLGLAAPNVTIVNSTAAFITWLPPERDNGVIIYYEIMRVNPGSGGRNIVNVSLQFSLLMTDMEPYTKYEFRVAASTAGGKTWSNITEVRTLPDSKSHCYS